MRSSQVASAILAPVFAAVLLAGCGSSAATTAAAGAQCGSGPRVEVVVELASKKVVDGCVSFKGSEIPALTAMKRSGIEFAQQHFSFGNAICQIDHEPKSYSSCFASGQPYWALFTWSGHGPWKVAQVGVSQIDLRNGNALGWHFGPGTPSAPPKPPKGS
ncbi:MAG: hypothetical protein ACYCYK_02635 [Candidatus Dormibacteria bacterium]